MNPKKQGQYIHELFMDAGKQLRTQFRFLQTNPHYGERGGEAEDIVKAFLNDHLPKRFSAETGFVVDDEGGVSKQCDIIIYDALNSPVCRVGSRAMILPSDNVASVFEVKSKLTKHELNDAAEKIASVKRLRRTELPQRKGGELARFMKRPLGVVFAFSAKTKPETVAKNLVEINSARPTSEWIDVILILDVAVIGYFCQSPVSSELACFGGAADDNFLIPPYYVHLGVENLGELALNGLLFNLIEHLAVYREQPFVKYKAMLGSQTTEVFTVQSYQYNLTRELVNTESYHTDENFAGPSVRFNLFGKEDNNFIGQIGWMPWQDGGVITYSGSLPVEAIQIHYRAQLKTKLVFFPVLGGRLWLSCVLPLGKEKFESATRVFIDGVRAMREDEPGGSLDFLGLTP
ncbi:hypothetical protein LLG46_05200 [bacterium]|nr:hypothetical protein [bacterium]